MLLGAGLGNEFWGHAVLATAYIMNRMPSRVHAGKTPLQIWTGVNLLSDIYECLDAPQVFWFPQKPDANRTLSQSNAYS